MTNIQIQLVTDEAEAALSILQKQADGLSVKEADWQVLFASQGYQLLKRREEQMGNPFDEQAFQDFLLAPVMQKQYASLAAGLAAWRQVDLEQAAGRALAYLPEDCTIAATIYPVIKPKPNSFIFEVDGQPAIFLFIKPEGNAARLENTLAHELHHAGYAGVERQMQQTAWWAALLATQRAALEWASALGEGVAMLAAAGGTHFHPHAVGTAEDRARWDADMANFAVDFQKLDGFFREVLSGRLQGQEMMETGFAYFGYQGPWYTVGWKTAATIETVLGRQCLVDCLRDPCLLFYTYNQAVRQMGETPLPAWSAELANLYGEAGL